MIRLGIEELLTNQRTLLKGKRVGLVSNYTVTDSNLRPVIRLMADTKDWDLIRLFGPEHGVKNSAKEGEPVDSSVDESTGLTAYSLYGESKRPTSEMLSNLDALVVDLQDIGSRYYTNMNTLAYCLEACAEHGIDCVVPDRPNPINGVSREGNILDMAFQSFVGMHAIPNRHGLTMGELALFINEKLQHPCNLKVVQLVDWHRDMFWPDTAIPFVPPSPNTATFEMCLLYPGTCLFEGVNVSVGRGTAHPFEYIGAPFIKANELTDWFNQQGLPGVRGRPVYFVPTYSQYTGELCEGIALHITDAYSLEPVRTGVVLMQGIAQLYGPSFEFIGLNERDKPFIDLLAGTSRFRDLLVQGRAPDYLIESASNLERFNEEVKAFEIYARGGRG
ncbi:exo-beta-N-acetylmuramidase NamZ domain-containing protein [Alicyclobacillus sp. SO9]|uniref:exo-beta-N-acetylmuramidase NamZ family protein n=1 Tax=Alicyclobacillus sp. SO9 TaxID=2665646 RepID=UPI0018E74475|nr:DUF1343 domain-containing protein [Alicyclobacillus sp. SO9]QQE79178.1 DUF1343 domain-containing protein [Alicyclobacillus sp. SO9]